MDTILSFLKSDLWVWVSNILLLYAILQIFLNKYIIRKHVNKTKYAASVISGGDSDKKRWEMEQEAYRYMKSRRYKLIELLKKIF